MAKRFKPADFNGKLLWDERFTKTKIEYIPKFLARYFNDHVSDYFGRIWLRRWIENPEFDIKFIYMDMPGINVPAATGRSWTQTIEIYFEDSDQNRVLNRVSFVLAVEILHAFLRYIGAEELESQVENRMQFRKPYRVFVGREGFRRVYLDGVDVDIIDSEGMWGYK